MLTHTRTRPSHAHIHDAVTKWKHFPRYWPFVRRIHRSPVNSPHKGQWRGALMFSLVGVWINGWVNNNEAGNLRRYRAYYDVTVIITYNPTIQTCKHSHHWQYWLISREQIEYLARSHINSNHDNDSAINAGGGNCTVYCPDVAPEITSGIIKGNCWEWPYEKRDKASVWYFDLIIPIKSYTKAVNNNNIM